MANIISVGTYVPPHVVDQETVERFISDLFGGAFRDLERLLKVFRNGQIKKRHFAVPLDWFKEDHDFKEKNDLYIDHAVTFGVKAIERCMSKLSGLTYENIDAIIFVSSSGISTPTIDAKIMNELPFSSHTKRIPLWGLGCAGGASGLSRGFEYVKAYPEASVLVVTVELCSLTFQQNDHSKSNLVGTSLFADGAACACITGNEVGIGEFLDDTTVPQIIDTQSELMRQSEDVMGWDVRNEGLFVIFSKDIPGLVRDWMKGGVEKFLNKHDASVDDISHFVAHPGGKKVLDAYVEAFDMPDELIDVSMDVLKKYGNMSSVTILFVLEQFLKKEDVEEGDIGLAAALGPGFSSELLLLKWKKVSV